MVQVKNICGGVVLSLALGGCGWLPVSIEGNERYNFQHAMLNQSRVAEFPKRFNVPTPFKTEVENTGDSDNSARRTLVNAGSDPANKSEEFAAEANTGLALERALESHREVRNEFNQREEDELVSGSIPSDRGQDGEGLADILGGMEPIADQEEPETRKPLSLRKHHDTTRTELAKFGKDSIGKAEREFQGGFIPSLLASIEKEGRLPDDTPSTLYKSLRNQGLSFETETPQLGDLVFFHNTFDANKDGRNNDWYSTCGVVTGVSGDGVVEFVATVNGKVDAFSLNVQRPEVRRDESSRQTLNSFSSFQVAE